MNYLLTVLLCACVSALHAEEASPLASATHRWDMSAESAKSFTSHGDVKLGVDLAGDERAASLARGGDGKVAQFNGGHLEIGGPGFDPPGAEFTLLLRVRDPQGQWNAPLFGSYGGDGKASLYLRGVDGATLPRENRNFTGGKVPTPAAWMFGTPDGPRAIGGSRGVIECLWGATNLPAPFEQRKMLPRKFPDAPLFSDASNAVLRVMFPMELAGPRDWHDVVVRGTGAKLQLWMDGVLLDEEFTMGTTRPATAPRFFGAAQLADGRLLSGFRGQMDHAALWHRAVSYAEIVTLSGGAKLAQQRELAILGDQSASMQYFRARGHNSKAGDCIPYWDDRAGTFRLFYLILRRNMHSKWDGGHGGLEVWQASTKDLKTWTHHPVTIPITQQWEAWNGTGGVAFHNGQYNWFYPTPDYYSDHGGVQRAVSKDGVTFTKSAPHPFLPGGDVEIFQTEDGLFHLIKAGPQQRAKTRPLRNKTLVAWVRCADLDQQGSGVLTIEHPDATQFDGIVFGEIARGRWMPGSDRHQRTPRGQSEWAEETSKPDAVVQVAVVTDGAKGTFYRNGALYAAYSVKAPLEFPTGSSLLMGLRHTTAGGKAFFHGRVLDARVYDTALSPEQLAALKPDAAAGPKPVAWYDFEGGSLRDRTGTFPDAILFGNARIEKGELVVGDGDYLKVPGAFYTQVRLTSPDLETWTEQPGSFIASDRQLATCPHVFKFGDWHYYICGNGVWKSRGWFGPWTENAPQRLDNLAVPKTGAFGNDRRIYAGFLSDDGWGGNEVLRELVQDSDGNLGTRFVNEMIPATGAPVAVQNTARVQGGQKRAVVELPGIPQNYRLQMEIVPEAGASTFGVSLRAGETGGCDLTFEPRLKRVRFSAMTGSAGKAGGGPAIEAVRGLDKPFAVDLIVRHDILDAEIAGKRSIVTRFWNPTGDRLRFFAEGGAVTFRNIRVSPLKETYKPYPAWTVPTSTKVSNPTEAVKPTSAPAKPQPKPRQPPAVVTATDAMVRDARLLRERFLADPYRPAWHFCVPEDMGRPGDPNGAFYHKGRYHLMYLYNRIESGFCWGHISSSDLVHWRHHPDAIGPGRGDDGCFSGGAFVDDDGAAYLSYWMLWDAKGIGLAKSSDPAFNVWTKLDANPVIRSTEWGITETKDARGKTLFYGSADPSNIWKKDGRYYMLTGNLLLLNKLGRKPDAPLSEQGDRLYLFVSDNLKDWKYLHVFYERKPEWTDRSEDNMCPSFLPLPSSADGGPASAKHLLLFISHNKGCQYYIGDYRNDHFYPDRHGRMSWVDSTYFAPEALVDAKGRQIMWAWLTDNHPGEKEKGWSGVYGLPRSLWLGDDGTLRMAPVKELEVLRGQEKSWNNLALADGDTKPLDGVAGDSCELALEFEVGTAQRCGLRVRASGDAQEETLLYYDVANKELVFDSTRSGKEGRKKIERAPLALKPGEPLKLRVFVDKSVVEIYANDRQAIGRRVYPTRPDSVGVSVFTNGGAAKARQVKAWQMAPSNPY